MSLIFHLFVTIFISVVRAIAINVAADSACTNLTSILGDTKVVSNSLDLRYVDSREDYWNTRQSAYAPSCIVFPQSAQDVSVALVTIRAAGSRFAVKAGGHNCNDFFSSVDRGVLIDLGSMTAKSYDASTTLATYEPGSNWGELYDFYAQYGRTVVGGRISGVGTGLALGGGLSYLSSQYGMACDSFRELEYVLPSGEIVTTSSTSNPDLFFAARGGGGNAFGIVTKYTVQSRPAGNFFAGYIVYLFDFQDAVLEAAHNFIVYNTDPKAAILPSYEKLGTPDLNIGLDEGIVVFLVYDAEDPGDAFRNFTTLPHLIDTTSIKSYSQVANMPLPFTAELIRGDNALRVGVQRIDNDNHKSILDNWRQWGENNKGNYVHTGVQFYPVPRSLTDASKANGGNAMQMPDGPWYWVDYIVAVLPGVSQEKYDSIQASFKIMVELTPNAPDLPLFLNEAAKDQNPLATFSTYDRLQQTREKYDPDDFFRNFTGGWLSN